MQSGVYTDLINPQDAVHKTAEYISRKGAKKRRRKEYIRLFTISLWYYSKKKNG